jgi:hypothetical protein
LEFADDWILLLFVDVEADLKESASLEFFTGFKMLTCATKSIKILPLSFELFRKDWLVFFNSDVLLLRELYLSYRDTLPFCERIWL